MSISINILNDPNRKLSRAEKRNILKRVPDCFKRTPFPYRGLTPNEEAHLAIREKYVDQQIEEFVKEQHDIHLSKFDLIRRISFKEFLTEKIKQWIENLQKKDL